MLITDRSLDLLVKLPSFQRCEYRYHNIVHFSPRAQFPKHSGLILSFISGAFDASSVPYLIYNEVSVSIFDLLHLAESLAAFPMYRCERSFGPTL